jgi:hypothetical protein
MRCGCGLPDAAATKSQTKLRETAKIALTLFLGGMNPTKNALVVRDQVDGKLDKAPDQKTKQSRAAAS